MPLSTPHINAESAVPLYHQVYLVLRQQLLDGQFTSDDALPGEEALRRRFGVSRVTIRKTLAALEKDGLITRVRGKGTFPTKRRRDERATISGLYENLVSVGLQTRAKLLAFGLVAAPALVRRADPSFGTEVLRIVRVRSVGREPFAYLRSYVPLDKADVLDKRTLGNQPLLMVFEKAGIVPSVAEQALTAAAATEDHAPHLKVALGTPLVHMTRLTRDQNGAAIEYFESFYRPDKYAYRLTLSRDTGAEAPRWVPIG